MTRKFTDKEIIEGLLSRNGQVCNRIAEQLYEQNNKSITHLVLRNNGVIEDAEDLFQEVLLSFFRHVWADKFTLQDDTKISTYLYAVAQKLWLKKLNKDGKVPVHEAEFVLKFSNPDTSPLNVLIEKEELETAQSIFKRLGELCQAILKAYYLEQKSMDEIAILFNLGNANTAKVKKFRCMKELSKLMNI